MITAYLVIEIIFSAVGSDATSIITEVEQNVSRFQTLPGLYLDYRLTYEHKSGAIQFTESWVEVINIYKKDSIYIQIKTKEEQREAAWNGTVGTELHKNTTNYIIRPNTGTWALGMQYYADSLFLPFGRARIEDPEKAPPWPPYYKGPDYWLPLGFDRNATHYELLPQIQTVDESKCVVLDWRGRDTIWLDPSFNYAIRRRDFRNPGGTMRDRVTCSNFQQVGEGLWLPWLIVHEQYCTTDDPPALRNQVSGVRTIRVSEMRVEEPPVETFVVQVPEDAQVTDMVRNITYERGVSTTDVIAKAEAQVRRELGESWPWTTWIIWLSVLTVVITVMLLILQR